MKIMLSRGAVLALFFSHLASALPLSPADRSTLEAQQQQWLEQNQQQREALERAVTLPSIPAEEQSGDSKGPCLPVTHIIMEGVTQMTARQQTLITSPWRGKCLAAAGIKQLTDEVSNWYIRRGFITSRAFIPEQNLAGGELHLTVIEGRIEKLQLEGESGGALRMAFPGLEGQILNLRDIEQGMEQINRLRSVPVQIEILPSKTPGYSVVNLTATPEFPLRASLSIDNSGQKSTGIGQLGGALTGNNLLGLAEQWLVSGGRSSDFANGRDAQNVQAGISLPYGYSLFDYSYSYSDYASAVDNRGYRWRSTGDSETHRVNVSRVLFRNGELKTGASLGLTHRITHNYLNDTLLKSSSHKLTSLQAGLNHTQKAAGGVATFNPVFSHGVSWLGAENDNGKKGDAPKAAFKKWSLNASYQRPVTEKLWWLSSLYGQWSPDRLYGSERLTLGGESSVRGFKEQYLSGDNGGYWRNELNYSLFTLPVIGQVNLLAALDGGWLQKDNKDPQACGTLWGAAAGISFARRYYTSQFTVGLPVKYPDWLGPDRVSVYSRFALAF